MDDQPAGIGEFSQILRGHVIAEWLTGDESERPELAELFEPALPVHGDVRRETPADVGQVRGGQSSSASRLEQSFERLSLHGLRVEDGRSRLRREMITKDAGQASSDAAGIRLG